MKIIDQGSANNKYVKQKDICDAIELLSSEEQRGFDSGKFVLLQQGRKKGASIEMNCVEYIELVYFSTVVSWYR